MNRRWRREMRLAGSVALLLVLALAAPAAAGQSWDGQGRITAVDPAGGTVTIDHGGIAGLLPASQSEFPVQSASLMQGLHVGDRVRFALGAADDAHGLLAVTSLVAEGPARVAGFDRTLMSVAAVLALLALGVAAIAVILWRQLRALHQRVAALDHDAGLLRGLVMDTQDGVRQITRALEEAATALRVGYVQELRRRLAPGASPASAEAAGDKAAGETATGLVVVQRGRGDLYRAVERGAAGPGLAVIWDRRRTERRRGLRRPVGHERRNSERRGSPPETWTRLGFQLVPGGADVPRTPRVLRPVSGERAAGR